MGICILCCTWEWMFGKIGRMLEELKKGNYDQKVVHELFTFT